MPRTLYVHVGPKKTATSAIQGVLTQHDNTVVIFPKVAISGAGRGHFGLVDRFFQEYGFEDEPAKELFDSLYSEIAQSDRNILISSEALEHRDAGAFAGALASRVNDPSMNLEILISCREHFSRAASWYNHQIRARKFSGLPDEFLNQSSRKFCYAPLIQRLKSTGFKVTALSYHPSEDFVPRFLSYIGFQAHEIPGIKRKKIGFSSKALIARLATTTVVTSDDAASRYERAFKRLTEARMPSGFIFGPEAAEKAENQFSFDRKFLFDEFEIRLEPPNLQANSLFIDQTELTEIATLAEGVGPYSAAIIDFARRFVRDEAKDCG